MLVLQLQQFGPNLLIAAHIWGEVGGGVRGALGLVPCPEVGGHEEGLATSSPRGVSSIRDFPLRLAPCATSSSTRCTCAKSLGC